MRSWLIQVDESSQGSPGDRDTPREDPWIRLFAVPENAGGFDVADPQAVCSDNHGTVRAAIEDLAEQIGAVEDNHDV